MDVPTLAWDPRGEAEWRGRRFEARASAPYLTAHTGRLWRSIDTLGAVCRGALSDRAAIHPRQWVLENMTDAICAAALLNIIRDGAATVTGNAISTDGV